MDIDTRLINIKSKYVLQKIFDNVKEEKILTIIKYSKALQNKIDIDLNYYKDFKKIEIEIIPIKNRKGKTNHPFINILNKEDESHYHIYFNDDYKTEIKSYNLTFKDKYITKIRILNLCINYFIHVATSKKSILLNLPEKI